VSPTESIPIEVFSNIMITGFNFKQKENNSRLWKYNAKIKVELYLSYDYYLLTKLVSISQFTIHAHDF